MGLRIRKKKWDTSLVFKQFIVYCIEGHGKITHTVRSPNYNIQMFQPNAET